MMQISKMLTVGSLHFSSRPASRDLFFILTIMLLVAIKLWLVEAHDFMARWAPHDDYLFIRQARFILSGEWLGPYNQLTLIKGPVYPLFIALSHLLCIPLLLAQQLLYAFACIMILLAFRPLVQSRTLLLLVFAFLLLNPFTYNYPAVGRAFRLGIYMALILLIFSCMIGMITRFSNSVKSLFLWSVGLGFSFSLLWYTREESIWILPSMILFFIIFFMVGPAKDRLTSAHRIIAFGITITIFSVITFFFSYMNYVYYGTRVINELKSKEFISAYGGLMNIKVHNPKRRVVVNASAQAKAFTVSPTFQELQPYFETGGAGATWPASFYIWELRERAREAGYHKNLPESLAFYGKIGSELSRSCKEGRLDCLERAPSLRPPWYPEYNSLLVPTFVEILNRSLGMRDFSAKTKGFMSIGDYETMKDFQYVTREYILPSRPDIIAAYPEFYQHMKTEKVRILQDIGSAYGTFIPAVFWVSVALHILLIVYGVIKKKFPFEPVFAFVLLGGYISLLFILSFLKITLWPVDRPLHAVYPVILLYIVFIWVSFYRHLAQGWHVQRRL